MSSPAAPTALPLHPSVASGNATFSCASVPLRMLFPLLFPSFTSLLRDCYTSSRPSLEATSPGRPEAHPPGQAD